MTFVTSEGLERGMLDESTLESDLQYRFVHERPQRQVRARVKGYRPVSVEEDGVKTLMGDQEESDDDLIHNGDTILMCRPKAAYEAERRKKTELTARRLESATEKYENEVKEAERQIGQSIPTIGADKED